MEIYLIRHTTPAIAKGICYGQTDLDIDKKRFAKEAKSIQNKLPKNIEAFYSSPLKRCQLLAEKLSNDFKTDKNLMELNFGKWENKSWKEINQTELNPWMEDFVNIPPPEGESYAELHQRSIIFVDSLWSSPYKKVALITHAGVIRSIISEVLGLTLENSFRLHLNYGAVVKIQFEKDRRFCKLISIQ